MLSKFENVFVRYREFSAQRFREKIFAGSGRLRCKGQKRAAFVGRKLTLAARCSATAATNASVGA